MFISKCFDDFPTAVSIAPQSIGEAHFAEFRRLAGQMPAPTAVAEVHPPLLPAGNVAFSLLQVTCGHSAMQRVLGLTLIAESDLVRHVALTKASPRRGDTK